MATMEDLQKEYNAEVEKESTKAEEEYKKMLEQIGGQKDE